MISTTNKEFKDETLVSNQYPLFDSSSFGHSDCVPTVKTYATKQYWKKKGTQWDRTINLFYLLFDNFKSLRSHNLAFSADASIGI